MNGAQGIAALIHIFLEEANGEWVAVSDLARLMALDSSRVVEALHDIQEQAPGANLALKLDELDQVIAARMGNGASEAP